MNINEYKDYLLEANFSDLIWHSTRKDIPTSEDSLVVYNTRKGYRVDYFIKPNHL